MCSIAGNLDSVQSISATRVHIADTRNGSSPSIRAFEEILEFRELSQEGKLHNACRAVPLLGNDKFRLAHVLVVRLVNFFAIDKHHEIGILLD